MPAPSCAACTPAASAAASSTFPASARAADDTHHRTSVVRLSAAALALHRKPFAALLPLAGAAMVAHAVYPALDPEERPASLSPPIIEDLLRGELGFDGLAVSDDLEMEALGPWGDLPVRAEAAFAAGCDVVLACATTAALPAIVARLGRPATPAGAAKRRAGSPPSAGACAPCAGPAIRSACCANPAPAPPACRPCGKAWPR